MIITESFHGGEVTDEYIQAMWHHYDVYQLGYGIGYSDRRSWESNYRYNYDMYTILIKQADLVNIDTNQIIRAIKKADIIAPNMLCDDFHPSKGYKPNRYIYNGSCRWNTYSGYVFGEINGNEFQYEVKYDRFNAKIDYGAIYKLIDVYTDAISKNCNRSILNKEFRLIYERAVFNILCVQGRNVAQERCE